MRQNTVTRFPLLTLTLALFAIAPGGCYPADQAPDADGSGDAPAVDWTTYAGLHIYAERWEIDTVKNVVIHHDEFGPVDLLEFENAHRSPPSTTIRSLSCPSCFVKS